MNILVKQDILMSIPDEPMLRKDIDAGLLDLIIDRLRHEVYFANEEDYIVWALWIVQTWLVDLNVDSEERTEHLFDVLVRLCLRAPIGHGKTVALNTLRRYSRKGIKSDKMTTAVAFRMAEGYGATIVLDEYQSLVNKEDGLGDFVILGYNHDKKYQRAHKDDMGTDAYNASVPVAFSMKTTKSKEDSMSRCLEFIIPKAPVSFEPSLVRSTLNQSLYELRVWAQQPDNLDHLMSIKAELKPLLMREGIYHREKDNIIGICVIAKLFGKEDWLHAIIDKSKASIQTLKESLAVSIDGFILDAIDILTNCMPFEVRNPVSLSAMRSLVDDEIDTRLNVDKYTADKVRDDKSFLTRSIHNYGFKTKESRDGTKRDYRIDFTNKASRDAYEQLRKSVRGDSDQVIQAHLNIEVEHPSDFYGLTDEEYRELEETLGNCMISDNGVRKIYPEIRLDRLVKDGVVKIDHLGIVRLKLNRPGGTVLALSDCF